MTDDNDLSGLLHHGFRNGPLPLVEIAVGDELAAFDPNSGTASLSTAVMVARSSLAIACSSAESHVRKACIGGSLGLAAITPARPISMVGSSLANNISLSR